MTVFISTTALLKTLPTTGTTDSGVTTITTSTSSETSGAHGLSINFLLSLILASFIAAVLQL